MHRRLINPTLAALSSDRARYFCALVDLVERDPRTENLSNLLYLVLKETIPYLSINLPDSDLAKKLFVYVGANRARLNKILFDPQYLENPTMFSNVTKEFVLTVLTSTLVRHEIEEAEAAKQRAADTYRFSWPDYNSDNPFPYDDEEEDGAGNED